MGKDAGEMLPIITSAMNNKTSAYKLSNQIFTYPTRSEAIKKTADAFVVGTLGNIKKDITWFLKDNLLQILTATVWIVLVVLFLSYKSSNDLSVGDIAINMYNFMYSHPAGPIIYIIAYALRPIILFPASLLTLIAGVLFGPWWGIVYSTIGSNLSANFAYLLGMIFGKKLLQ